MLLASIVVGPGAKKRFEVDGERKLAQLLSAVPGMPADKRDDLLAYRFANGSTGFSAAAVRKLLIGTPAILTTLSVADVPLFDKTLTVEEAKALAPHLARSPHPQAALVRVFATGDRRASAAIDAILKTEMWRFPDVKTMADLVWNGGVFERDGGFKESWKDQRELAAPYPQIKKQVSKQASASDRMAASETLTKDLLGASPSIPAALALWTELFASASDEDTVALLKSLVTNLEGDREFLLHQALANVSFKKAGRMPWQAVPP